MDEQHELNINKGKERDLTQSYDKSPYANRKLEKQLDMCLWNTDAPGGNKVKILKNL